MTIVISTQDAISETRSFLGVKELIENKQIYDNKMVTLKGTVVYKYACECPGGVCRSCAINHLGIADSRYDTDYLLVSFFNDDLIYNSFKLGDQLVILGEYSFTNPVGVSNSFGSFKFDSIFIPASPSPSTAPKEATSLEQLKASTEPLVLASNRLFPIKSFSPDLVNEIVATSDLKNKGFNEIDVEADSNFGLGSGEGIDVKVLSRLPDKDDSGRIVTSVPAEYRQNLKFFEVTTPPIVNKNMLSAKIFFSLKAEELKNFKREQIILLRFSNGLWSELNTSIESVKTDGYTEFSATTPGFSLFIVAAKSESSAANPVTPIITSVPEEINQKNESLTPENTTVTSPSPANQTATQTLTAVPTKTPSSENKVPVSGLATADQGISKNLPLIIIIAVFILGALYFTVRPGGKKKEGIQPAEKKATDLYTGSDTDQKTEMEEIKKQIEQVDLPEEKPEEENNDMAAFEFPKEGIILEDKKETETVPEIKEEKKDIVKDSDYLSFHAEAPRSENELKPEDLLVIRFVKGKPEIVEWRKSPGKPKRKYNKTNKQKQLSKKAEKALTKKVKAKSIKKEKNPAKKKKL
ncbi:MAG TPA: PGF-pre-PGF domain-containing protein [archaeon]|nr:PGF-pre-PGF domain-containing protein [archaeon]